MWNNKRSTMVVNDQHSAVLARLDAARNKRHGLQVMTFEQMAIRLSGGFNRGIDDDSLRIAIQQVISDVDLGELENIKSLPGMIDAAAGSLSKVWRAGIALENEASTHPRIAAMSRLEAAVLSKLPSGMMRPTDLCAAAMQRLPHAAAVLGPIEISSASELAPCWRELLAALPEHTTVCWNAGPRALPPWITDTTVAIRRSPASTPTTTAISAATPYHEAIEALRWARQLLSEGIAASDIAIATASPSEYDDYFLGLRADANIELHFAHGISVLASRDGQAAAALADILLRGLSRNRLIRLFSLSRDAVLFKNLPDDWAKVLPTDAALATPAAWDRLLARLTPADWSDATDLTPELRTIVGLLTQGITRTTEAGPLLLQGRALAIWNKALLSGPPESLENTLQTLRQDDGLQAECCVTWMPAAMLAGSPRPHVRLIGLNSSRWPRPSAEDRLIPRHIMAPQRLDPVPTALSDRLSFTAIVATTASNLVLSNARRDRGGRQLGRSPLLSGMPAASYVARNAVPPHAASETDRLTARPDEFAATAQASSAQQCWVDWHRPEITSHDGVVDAQHPLLLQALARTQSASSLQLLLRNPLHFIWKYALGWRLPNQSDEPLLLDALDMGNLTHMVLDHALQTLEADSSLSEATPQAIGAAVENALSAVADKWQTESSLPPAVIWQRTLDDVRTMAINGLRYEHDALGHARSYSEVAFGGSAQKIAAPPGWNTSLPVPINGTRFCINGYIDRLDISADGLRARVRDYKTGRAPDPGTRFNGGRELQRCLYAFAVRTLLGPGVRLESALLYLRTMDDLPLDNPDDALNELVEYLMHAQDNLAGGAALPGPDAAGTYDDLAFALPANAGATYCKLKKDAIATRMHDATLVWEAP